MNEKKTNLVTAIIISLIMALMSYIFIGTGVVYNENLKWMNWLSQIPFLGGMILHAMNYAKLKDNYVTFGNLFTNCFRVVMMVTIFAIAFSFLSMVIFPGMKERIIELSYEKMKADPKLNDEQIEVAMQMTKNYWNLFMIGGIIFGYLASGAIYSLIAAAIPKKKGENPFGNVTAA